MRHLREICLWYCEGCGAVRATDASQKLTEGEVSRIFVCPNHHTGAAQPHFPVALQTSDHTLVTEFVTVKRS